MLLGHDLESAKQLFREEREREQRKNEYLDKLRRDLPVDEKVSEEKIEKK